MTRCGEVTVRYIGEFLGGRKTGHGRMDWSGLD